MSARPREVVPPRECEPDLPRELDEVVALRPRDEVYAARITGLEAQAQAAHGRIVESVIEECLVDRLDLDGAVLADVRITGLRAAVLSACAGRWRTVRIEGGRIGTLDLSRADLARVELRGVRVDYLTLASATVEDLLVADCVFTTVDLPATRIDRTAFTSCRADEVDTREMRVANLDLRGLDALSFTDPKGLRGATLTEQQAERHAAEFAAALGVRLA